MRKEMIMAVMLVLAISVVSAGPTFSRNVIPVIDCMILDNTSAMYVQMKDINAAGANPCIDISKQGVRFNGNNRVIKNGVISIRANVSDVSIMNVNVQNSSYGLSVSQFIPIGPLMNINITDSRFENNTYGIWLNQFDTDYQIKRNTFVNNDVGLTSRAGRGILFDNNSFYGNRVAMWFECRNGIGTCANNTIRDLQIMGSIESGLLILTTSNFWFNNNSLINSKLIKNNLDLNMTVTSMSFTQDPAMIIDNSTIGSYKIRMRGAPMLFKNYWGEIKFIEAINGSGQALTQEIYLAKNKSVINTTINPGFNRSSIIQLKDIGISPSVSVYRNGQICTICALLSYDLHVAVFNTTSEGTYHVA